MSNALCICPNFLSKNIGDARIYIKVFIENLATSDDQIILDSEDKLTTSYISSIADNIDAYNNFTVWKRLLDNKDTGKILRSSSHGALSPTEVVYKTTSSAPTTFNKSIIAEDNNHYIPFISEINRQRISLLNLNNITTQVALSKLFKNPTYAELEEDIEWILQRLSRSSSREKSENDHNDYLRDMLLAKSYEAKDQTREGTSSSGISAGELDIIVEDRKNLFTIIEAMKLNCINQSYIEDHYKKLTDNYNPLGVKRTYLVTYYHGANFNEWWGRYTTHIESMPTQKLSLTSKITSEKLELAETQYTAIKKMHHHLLINEENTICTHLAVRLT